MPNFVTYEAYFERDAPTRHPSTITAKCAHRDNCGSEHAILSCVTSKLHLTDDDSVVRTFFRHQNENPEAPLQGPSIQI